MFSYAGRKVVGEEETEEINKKNIDINPEKNGKRKVIDFDIARAFSFHFPVDVDAQSEHENVIYEIA